MPAIPSVPTPINLVYNAGGNNWLQQGSPYFAIPSGTWTSGTITYTWSWANGGPYGGLAFSLTSISNDQVDILSSANTQSTFTLTFPLQAANLAAVNAGAGTNVNILLQVIQGPTWLPGPVTLTLNLVGTGTGGTVSAYTFTATTGPCNNGCDLMLVQLLDNTGKSANAPVGGQVFSLSCPSNGISFNPASPITIPQGSSNISDLFCALNTGTYQVTITPGTGPLNGVAAQTIPVSVCGSIIDPYLNQGLTPGTCKVTRIALRDAITRKLFGWCPADVGQGNPGDLPTGRGFDWAIMGLWNQSISETISDINVKSKFHTTVNLQISVPVQSLPGPQFVNLQGVQGCPTEQSINTVRRLVWYDASSPMIASTPPLTPVSFEEMDRLGGTLDNYQPGIPNMFFITGYQIALLPASVNGGNLSMYAGTAITQFLGDTDYIDQLPNDYLPIIVEGAAMRICEANLDKQNIAAMYPIRRAAYLEGIGTITGWTEEINEGYQPSFGVSSSRWPGRKMPVVVKKRGNWA